MESPSVIVGIFLCLLCLTRAIVLPKEVEKDINSTESEEAIVKEVPQPEMTLQSGSGNFDYRLPGYYTFNNGEPFFVEKDPLTGAIDFNKKTTSTAVGTSSTDSVKDIGTESDSEYVYDEEETVPDQEQDEIDRKDSNVDGYRPNDIIKSPYKISPDLHQFLNLPVHYSSSDKFPLISSSYANTKIQGSSGIYSNHKYVTTSSTPSPSYYTFKHTSVHTTPMPVTKTTTTTTTTTTMRPQSTTAMVYTEVPEDEYENPDDLAYGDYEVDEQFDNHHIEYIKTQKPDTTTKPLQTTYIPSTAKTTSTTITTTPPTSTPAPTSSTTISTTTNPATTTRLDTTIKTPTSTTEEKNVSIVTSLPLDVYYSSIQPETSVGGTNTTSSITDMHKNASSSSMSTASSTVDSKLTNTENAHTSYTSNQFAVPNEGYYHTVDEPFRPIFGPGGKVPPTGFSKPKPENTDLVGNKVQQFHKLPEDQTIAYSQRPTGPPKLIGVEPPKLDTPQNFYSEQPVKLVPGQHTTITFLEPSKVNTIVRPIQEPHFDRPERPITNKPHYPPFQLPTPNLSNDKTPQNQRPIYQRPNTNKPIYNNGKPFNQIHHKPEEVIYPHQRPTGVIPPSYATKPVSFIDIPPPKLQPQLHQPTKVESHFIKVSPNQENPSYSLQTSFSIGMPSDIGGNNHQKLRPGQGIGQVLLPDEDPQISDGTKNSNLPPHRIRLPPNSHPPIQNYPLNRPGLRPPGPMLPQRPPPSRLPPPSMPDFRPPNPNQNTDNYPRPHWESHTKPTFINPQQQNALSKQDVLLPPQFPGLNRIKNENNQRYDLPNILPQFRPNAKVGFDGYNPYFGSPERLREPVDTLQPPPLPSRLPQLRVNRNDEELNDDSSTFEDSDPTQLPLVHRRTGAQASSRVTTLQMMKQSPPRRTVLRNQPEKKDRPVFLVYPTNSASKSSLSPSSSSSLSEGVVVVGTRGPQKPVHPSNLKPDDDKIEDDLDSFPLDNNKKFPIPGRERVDTPILKTKVTSKPVIKSEFPYAILKPEKTLPEERILSGGSKTNEYTAFSPTISSSTEDIKDHDSEINIIPYLQDYMPFAIKRPLAPINPKTKHPFNKTLNAQQISTSLNLVTTSKPTTTTEQEKIHEVRPSTIVNKNVGSSEGSEFTVSAVMHTHIQQQQQEQQQQQPYQHVVQHQPSNHRPDKLTYPKPLDFQAPFQASLSAPETQGWSVVKPNSDRIDEEKDRMDTGDDIVSPKPENEVSKFDFENFKPQLFGGFKPIVPTAVSESEEKVENKSEKTISLKSDREERKLQI